MSIARAAIERPIYTWILILFCLIGGALGYLGVGKLEDPTFTLKTALVITPYPGATADEVASEVSEVLESEIQRMGEVDYITSRNTPGLSVIEVEIKPTYGGSELPQVWNDLRARVADAAGSLPPGALPAQVNDTFGDIFGIYYAVTAPGFADAEIHEIAQFLRREVLGVRGVANADLLGLPDEAVFVEPNSRSLATIGVPPGVILGAIGAVSAISPTGAVSDAGRNLRIEPPRPEGQAFDIRGLTIGAQGDTFSLADIAAISRGRVDQPQHVIRHNGVEAFTLGIAGLQSENIVDVGARVEARLAALSDVLPVGVTIEPIYQQHRVVGDANGEFLVSLALSVAVVIAVLALFMGWRASLVVGLTLLLTVTFTFFFMMLFDIKVERISLGALIIAMGMLVDNAIVVAEGMQIEMRKGRRAADAAAETARKTQVPLLGATIIGAMAFAGIGLSPDASGEFLFSLFAVITISLMLSWVLSVTVTPLLGSYLFRTGGLAEGQDPYAGAVFRGYAAIVRGALRVRWLIIVALVGGTVACFGAMSLVTQQFFPPASTPLFYLNYKAAQGTQIQQTLDDLEVVEAWLAERDDVTAVTTTAGRSLTRFILTYTPAKPDPSYGQLLIRATSFEAIPALRDDLAAFAQTALPWAETRVEQVIYGPPVTADVEVRLSGPDPDVLRDLSDQALAIFNTSPLLQTRRVDWRERVFTTRPFYAADRAQALGVTRSDVATALALATDGVPAGAIREGERDIPIIVRTPRAEMTADGRVRDQIVFSPATAGYVALDQVIDGFEVITRDSVIVRRDRMPTLSVQGFTVPGVMPPTAFAQVRAEIEALDLPPGYRMAWGGEHESAGAAQASLGKQMPMAFGTMFLITVLLFGKLRQTAVIWTVVPMAVNGVAFGLLFTGLPFSFTALLGLLSLSGMLIKNAIVLVEEIDIQKDEGGLPQSEAIVRACVSRLNPVVLAAVTTILGMAPLLFDVFFASMAVTIMAGLAFATVLTLIGVPVFYATYLRKERMAERRQNKPQADLRVAVELTSHRLAAE
ncbi:Multidrug efflux pump subunit AcrB [Loktanella fryxellensis]|uniref:Multidrug efflux pump subunit AcrB n=1 Tax=Loktanella fryxellensis TaxID=245187 RepID=A0A1H8JK02_9RHOB|nr:efflux RND transporter permease subunit [Loktanella fryxellensis]SEN80881.1 Multidrug efflux pump subunit AcrB [Loktanella fryxellensis]